MFANMDVLFMDLAGSDLSHVAPFCAQDSPESPLVSHVLCGWVSGALVPLLVGWLLFQALLCWDLPGPHPQIVW